tara:strand:- start:234 stop:617 length:384 start_codon:yes stop_codon:yes gene_type:complete
MSKDKHPILQFEKEAHVATSVFFNIVNAWNVKLEDQLILLGLHSTSVIDNMKAGKVTNLSDDTLNRISYIIRIYKALGILFSVKDQAHAWPRKPNAHFNNESALKYMLKGNVTHLSDVCRYLNSQYF